MSTVNATALDCALAAVRDGVLADILTARPFTTAHEGWTALTDQIDAWPENNDTATAVECAHQIAAVALRFALDMAPRITEGAAHAEPNSLPQ